MHQQTNRRLLSYLRRGTRVPGWLDNYSAEFIAALSTLQSRHGIEGSVGEIGVHMGRLFILLKLTIRRSERCFAVDVFDRQHLNVDQSGNGNRQRFLNNVRRWTGDIDVAILEESSLDVNATDITNLVGPSRLVSIDGSHTEGCTFHDLQLVDAVLCDAGVAVLDDYFHQSWPGVAAGASRYFLTQTSTLKPFAITPNKLYLARPHHHSLYRALLRQSQDYYFEKSTAMFTCEVDVYGCNGKMRSLTTRMRQRIRRSRLGPYLKAAKERLALST